MPVTTEASGWWNLALIGTICFIFQATTTRRRREMTVGSKTLTAEGAAAMATKTATLTAERAIPARGSTVPLFTGTGYLIIDQ